MNLIAVLQQSSFAALSDPDALAALTANVTKTDDTQHSTTTVGRQLLVRQLMSVNDVASMTTWLPAIAGGGQMLFSMLGSKDGANFNDAYLRPQIEAVIASLAAGDPNIARLQALLSLGQWTVPAWQDMGLSQAPQLSDITAARATLALNAWWSRVAGEIAPGILAGTYTTQQAVQTAIQGIS